MLTPADMKRFTEFLDGEKLMAPLRFKTDEVVKEALGLNDSDFSRQMLRVYCQRYDCFDQYKDWVAFFELARKMEFYKQLGDYFGVKLDG